MLRNILLVLVTWVFGCVVLFFTIPSYAQHSMEVRQQQCNFLTDHFAYIYALRVLQTEEPLVEEIVARDPSLDPEMQWPLYLATVLIYQFPNAQMPDLRTWLFATQLACVRVIGTDFLEPRGPIRFYYRSPRMEILFK